MTLDPVEYIVDPGDHIRKAFLGWTQLWDLSSGLDQLGITRHGLLRIQWSWLGNRSGPDHLQMLIVVMMTVVELFR
jgi:hypothetical protein